MNIRPGICESGREFAVRFGWIVAASLVFYLVIGLVLMGSGNAANYSNDHDPLSFKVAMPSGVHISHEDLSALEEVSIHMVMYGGQYFITGHASPDGPEVMNLSISLKRAVAVEKLLRSYGVGESRLVVYGVGSKYLGERAVMVIEEH